MYYLKIDLIFFKDIVLLIINQDAGYRASLAGEESPDTAGKDTGEIPGMQKA